MDVYGGYNYNYRIHGDCKARNITGGPPPCGLLVSRVEEIELSTEVSWILGKLVPAHLDFGETCPGCSGVNFNLLLIKSLCLSLHVHVSCMKQFSFSSSSHATCQIVYSNDQLRSSTSGRPFPLSFLLMLEKSILDEKISKADILQRGALLACIWRSLR